VLVTPASATMAEQPMAKLTLDERLERQQAVLHHDRQVLRFFRSNEWLLKHPAHRANARQQVRFHRAQLRWTALELVKTRRALVARERRERLRRLRGAPPHRAIRAVFGRYADQALVVARCESHLSVRAQNGQYLGLFQMGRNERAVYGHGSTAYQQARAAHRYFVASGRAWGPWSCKPV
jgi:hypothetical protein